MSQVPIPTGTARVTAPGSAAFIFSSGDMVSGEQFSALINVVVKAVNGGLTDANVKAPGGTYNGIAESKIAFVDTDEVGHTHDGQNSAPLAAGSVDDGNINALARFANVVYTNNPAQYPVIASGRTIMRWKQVEDWVGNIDTATFTIRIPYQTTILTPVANTFRTLVSNWFIPLEGTVRGDIVKTVDILGGQWKIISETVASGTISIEIEILTVDTIVMSTGWFGFQWICMFDATFSNPVS